MVTREFTEVSDNKRQRLSSNQNEVVVNFWTLPPHLWARSLGFLSVEDAKQCALANKTFRFEVTPQIVFPTKSTIRFVVHYDPLPDSVEAALCRAAHRFKGISNAHILSTQSTDEDVRSVRSKTLKRILTQLGGSNSRLRSLVIDLMDCDEGYKNGPAAARDSSLPEWKRFHAFKLYELRLQNEVKDSLEPVRSSLEKLELDTNLVPDLVIPGLLTLNKLRSLKTTLRRDFFDSFYARNKHSGNLVDMDYSAFGKLESMHSFQKLHIKDTYLYLGDFRDMCELLREGICRIKSLRSLYCESYVTRGWNNNAVDVLHELPHLEDLGSLAYFYSDDWKHWCSHSPVTNLKRVLLEDIDVQIVGYTGVEDMVDFFMTKCPQLSFLDIGFNNCIDDIDDFVQKLAPLRLHPSLKTIHLGEYFSKDWTSEVEQCVADLEALLSGSAIVVKVGKRNGFTRNYSFGQGWNVDWKPQS